MRSNPRRLVATIVVSLATVAVADIAAAHTDLDYTLPTDGASVGEPVAEVVVAFTDPVTLVGVGFEVLDPQGNPLVPFAVTDDDTIFRLQLDPPIGGGTAGVRYEVTSADGHVIDGSFSFTIDAPAPSTTAAPPTVSASSLPSSSVAPSTSAATSTTGPPVDSTPETTTQATTTVSAVVSTESSVAGDDDGSSRTTLYLMAVGAGVAALVAFVMIRSRR